MLRKIINPIIITIVLAAVFAACNNGIGGGGGGGGGSSKTGGSGSSGSSKISFTVTLRGTSGSARAAAYLHESDLPVVTDISELEYNLYDDARASWPHESNPSILKELEYNVTATGNGETINRSTKGNSVSISVTPGRWNINVEARYKGSLYGKGSKTVEVQAGQSSPVTITLSQPSSSGGGSGTGSGGKTTPKPPTPPTPPPPPPTPDGTPGNPFKITSLAEFLDFRDAVNAGDNYAGKYFQLEGNITLSGPWTPISSFKGIFNGNGNTISGLSGGTGTDNFGLFTLLEPGGVVENLKLEGNPAGDWNTGSIVGNNEGIIRNCYSDINATVKNAGGGIAGTNSGTIINCYSTGSITTTIANNNYCGGIVSWNAGGTVENCYSTVSINDVNSGPPHCIGGIGGYFTGGNIKNSVALNTFLTTDGAPIYRIAGNNGSATIGTFTNNYASTAIAGIFPNDIASDRDGESIAPAQADDKDWWKESAAGGGPGWTIHDTKVEATAAIEADPTASPWWWDGTRPRLWFE